VHDGTHGSSTRPDHHDRALSSLDIALGELLMRSGQLDEAVCCFERALAADTDPAGTARACHGLGIISFARQDRRSAEEYWTRAIETNDSEYAPTSASCLGQLLMGQERLAEAREAFQIALESGHREAAPNARLALGAIADVEGDFELARSHLQDLPDTLDRQVIANAAIMLGIHHFQQRRHALAEAALYRGMPAASRRTRDYGRVTLGVIHYEQRKYEEAIQILQTAVASISAQEANLVAGCVNYLASALIESGRPREADELWRTYSAHADPVIAARVLAHRRGTARRLAWADLGRDCWRATFSRSREQGRDGGRRLLYHGVIKVRTGARTWITFESCRHRHAAVTEARRCAAEWLEGWLADLAQERDGVRRAQRARSRGRRGVPDAPDR
jgi:tetratricopeptide (TPR) repeat protein